MSIPRAVWNCPVCWLETDFPEEPRYCLIKDCPHPARIKGKSMDEAAEECFGLTEDDLE